MRKLRQRSRLYYFTSTKWGLEAIQKRRLKVARILELNDPFEFLAPVLNSPNERVTMNRWKRDMSERYGIICLSADWQHPLLWGHYGEEHTGMCLGFEPLQPDHFHPIEYTAMRPTLRSLGVKDIGSIDEKCMKQILHMKYDSWSYEQEHRSFVRLEQPENGLYFLDFLPSLSLRQVIVGSRSEATRAQVQEAIGDLRTVGSFRARPAFQLFKVVRNLSEKSWA
jgi:hypothetical protein